jgi:large subunit ribosomal protein L7/L12
MKRWQRLLRRAPELPPAPQDASTAKPGRPLRGAGRTPPARRPPPALSSGPYTVSLTAVGLLEERVAQKLARLTGLELSAAQALLADLPATLLRGVDEATAHRVQQTLQMLGAVVEVRLETAVASSPPLTPSSPAASDAGLPVLTRRPGPFNLYLRETGPDQSATVALLQKLWAIWGAGDYGAEEARRFVARRLADKAPLISGVAEETAVALQERLVAAGARAAVHHAEDPARPDRYDPDRFGVTLQAAGPRRAEVITAVQEILAISPFDATLLVDGAPRALLTAVTVDAAMAAHQRLHALGARCTLDGPDLARVTLRDVARRPGDYRVVLERADLEVDSVVTLVSELLDAPDFQLARWLVTTAPSVVLTGVAQATAEAVRERLATYFARARVEPVPAAEAARRPHPQNPKLAVGEYDLILWETAPLRQIMVIQALRQIRPLDSLAEIKHLVDNAPVVALAGIEEAGAHLLKEQLEAAGASAEVERRRAS